MSVTAADNLRLCAEGAVELDRPRMAEVIARYADLLDAIDALHQPFCPDDDYPAYRACSCDPSAATEWPCPTARLLHPEEADRG